MGLHRHRSIATGLRWSVIAATAIVVILLGATAPADNECTASGPSGFVPANWVLGHVPTAAENEAVSHGRAARISGAAAFAHLLFVGDDDGDLSVVRVENGVVFMSNERLMAKRDRLLGPYHVFRNNMSLKYCRTPQLNHRDANHGGSASRPFLISHSIRSGVA